MIMPIKLAFCGKREDHSAHTWRLSPECSEVSCNGMGLGRYQETVWGESEAPLALVHSERVSGPPRDPSAATWENTAAPATHTGRSAFHSGVTHATDSTAFAMPLGAPKCPKTGCELTHPHLHAAEDMAERVARQAEVDAFLNPQITVEDLMHAQDKPMDFHAWWVAMADREAPTVQRKAEEYGTNSLVEMGRIWARAQGRDVTDLEAVEIGCFLYAYGKIQRVADALLKGKSPNVDSWKDAAIYAMMVMYSREKGTWP